MSREESTISSHEAIWAMIPAEAREDWAVEQAANDVKVQAVFELFAKYTFNQATIEFIKDGLEELVEEEYGVPPARSEEVFALADERVRWELGFDGEA